MKEEVKALREKYPAGTRVRCYEMNDDWNPVPPGTEGTVFCVDDVGQIHVKWDNGSIIALIDDVDEFEIVE